MVRSESLWMFPFQKQCLIMGAVNHYNRLMPILLCFTNTCLLFTTSGITIFGDVMRIDEILSAEVLLWWNWLIRGLSLNAFWNVQLALHLCYVLHICISIVQVLHLDIIICCSHYKWCISYLLLTKKKRCIYIRKVLWKKMGVYYYNECRGKCIYTFFLLCTNCSFCPATAFQGLLVVKWDCHFFLFV